MKYLKMLSLAAMACTVLMAFAAPASATTLTSGSGAVVKMGTEIHLTMKSKRQQLSVIPPGSSRTHARRQQLGKTTNETGATATGTTEILTMGNCTRPTHTISGGSLTIAWTTGQNGAVSGSGTEAETEVPGGGHCIYGTGEGTTLGTLTGAASSTSNATVSINAVLPLIETVNGVCSSTAKWVAEYTVTSPLGLKVVS